MVERTADEPALLAFFDWDSELPNFQKKMAATAAGDYLTRSHEEREGEN